MVAKNGKLLHSYSDFLQNDSGMLGDGKIVNDRTSHMDLDSGFLLNWSAHNSVIVSAAGIIREMG